MPVVTLGCRGTGITTVSFVEAQNWLREMGSDFAKACGLAGFEPEFVAERAKWRMQDGYRRLYDPSERVVNAQFRSAAGHAMRRGLSGF